MTNILVTYHHVLLGGFLTTLSLVGTIACIGIPLGVLFGILGGRYSRVVATLVNTLTFCTKVIPVLVLLFWMHYPLQALLGVVVNPFWTTVFALGLVNTIAMAHMIQTELALLPRAYAEAGKTLGMSMRNVLRYIELPIMVRRVAPRTIALQATMLEYTLFASLISVPELFRVAQSINATEYDPVAIYSLLVLFFFCILAPLYILSTFLQKRYQITYA